MRLRQFMVIVVAFTIGALGMRVVDSRTIMGLMVKAECNYHEGYDEGYRDRDTEDNTVDTGY